MAGPSTPVARALPGLLAAMLLGALDQTALTPALPAIAADLGGLAWMPAIVTAYVAAATAAMPLHGRLGDRYGRGPLLLVSVVLFGVGALGCALAGSPAAFLASRVVQGVGGGGLVVGAQAALGELVPPRERGRYLGLFGAVYVLAAVGGPLFGGVVVDLLSWRWIFLVHPPAATAAFIAIALGLRTRPAADRPPLDLAGAGALAATVVGAILLCDALLSPVARPGWAVPVWAGVATVGAAGWAVSARLARDPVLPPRLLRLRGFAVPAALSLVVGFGLFGTLTYLPAFAQITLGLTATAAGLSVTALMAGALTTMVVSGRLITRTGRYRRYPVLGTALAGLGLALFGLFGAGLGPVALVGVLLVIGVGVGAVMQVVLLAAQNSVDRADLGAATSTVLFLRQIGASAGVAVTGALVTGAFAARVPAGIDVGTPTPEALAALPPAVRDSVASAFGGAVADSLLFMAPLLGAASLLALALPRTPLRTETDTLLEKR
ncbi:MFS transporter [Nocardiopsis sp. CC223A]|uniref:MFS transporter n=1 Tax=Nocardiopsis sp. CC223A TaxID=3044051 RepID=UPI00278C4C6A|nr:MFS transporter [Nocardiopsis sp. CC223A]